MRWKAGFTLAELLVVMFLVALISMPLYAIFGSTVDMVRKVSRSEVTEDVDVFLEKFCREISNQVTFKGILFEGKETSLSFPSRIGPDPRVPMNKGIGRVSYLFDESHGTFARRQENLSQIYQEEEGDAILVLEGVTDVKFQYFVYAYDPYPKTYINQHQWVETWDPFEREGTIPFAVKVEFNCVRGKEQHAFERTVAIPIAESTR